MKFKKLDKLFGVHSDRIRKLGLKYIKSKYGVGSKEHKNYKERKDLINSIAESGYGYSMSPEDKSKELNEFYKKEKSDKDNFTAKLFKKYKQDNKQYNKKLSKFKDGVRNVTPEFINKIKELGGTVEDTDKNSELSVDSDGKVTMKLNRHTSDFEAAHEYQHLKNRLSGEHPGTKFDYDSMRFNNENYAKYNDSFNKPQEILDYSNHVLQEELSANRGRTMNPWIHSGRLFKGKSIKRSNDEGVTAQNTYNSRIGGYNPPSNRYNMDKDSMSKLKRNKELLGITDKVVKPTVTGHVNLK